MLLYVRRAGGDLQFNNRIVTRVGGRDEDANATFQLEFGGRDGNRK
jgi:hypothetical protein